LKLTPLHAHVALQILLSSSVENKERTIAKRQAITFIVRRREIEHMARSTDELKQLRPTVSLT
jgi:hypothetical protein